MVDIVARRVSKRFLYHHLSVWYRGSMKWIFFLLFFFFLFGSGGVLLFGILSSGNGRLMVYPKPEANFWAFRSIDTMKHSRDLAREKLSDASYDAVIDREIKAIADTGASHVAIATPYDEEFAPYLRRWVLAARRHTLSVWFRGNFSGWEKWFGYPEISREDHLEKTRVFIERHADLFEDGDAFSPCPECENGGPGDPRQTGDVSGYRNFLIDEYELSNAAFEKAGKRVMTHFFSMNGDVARLVMDKETTRRLGGAVTIDHYVKTPEMLAIDLERFARESDGRVVLGEFGAPIPDIHGKMNEEEQSKWLYDALSRISRVPNVLGVNYWTYNGSSTALWSENGEASLGASVLSTFYRPRVFYGTVVDELGMPISGASLFLGEEKALSNAEGYFELRVPIRRGDVAQFSVSAPGFLSLDATGEETQMHIVLRREHETRWFKVQKWLKETMRDRKYLSL